MLASDDERGPSLLNVLQRAVQLQAVDPKLTPRELEQAPSIASWIEARELIDELNPRDRINVISVDADLDSCFLTFSDNHAKAAGFLESLESGVTSADFTRANVEAARLLGRSSCCAMP